MTTDEWCKENYKKLPNYCSEDYYEIVSILYQQYLSKIKYLVENHQSEILIINNNCETKIITKILITVQLSYFSGNISLILCDENRCKVTLVSISDLRSLHENLENFVDCQINLIELLNENRFYLGSGQSLTLRLTGGNLLTDNILISTI